MDEQSENPDIGMNLLTVEEQIPNESFPGLISQEWDVFEENPRKEEDDPLNTELAHKFLKVVKVLSYFVSFFVVLGSAVVSKLSLLLMTSQADPMLKRTNLNTEDGNYRRPHHVIQLTSEERMSWIWCIFFVLVVPELVAALKCFAWCAFKKFEKPKKETFVLVMLIESLQAIGLSLLVFCVLPSLSTIWGAMVTNGVCFFPCLLSWISYEKHRRINLFLDSIALVCQLSVFIPWILGRNDMVGKDVEYLKWTLPLACALVSLNWWENYVSERSLLRFTRFLSKTREQLKETRFFIYLWVSLWRMLVFFVSMVVIVFCLPCPSNKRGDISCGQQNLKHLFGDSIFHKHKLDVYEVNADGKLKHLLDETAVTASHWAPVCLVFIHTLSTIICFMFCKFACRTCIQGIGFAFPISLTVPVCVSMVLALCNFGFPNVQLEEVKINPELPWYLSFKCDQEKSFHDFIIHDHAWVWILWIVSQVWITAHIWIPRSRRVGHRLFVQTLHNGILIDQSVTMNRWRDEDEQGVNRWPEEEEENDKLEPVVALRVKKEVDMSDFYENNIAIQMPDDRNIFDQANSNDSRKSDNIVRIYMCATMWHENPEEMTMFLKSVFRMDQDQCYRRVVRTTYGLIKDSHYYTLETHIFFDDAFTEKKPSEKNVIVNSYVKQLLNVIDKAASEIHKENVIVRPPKRIPTPYGGKLEWTLPGRTKLIVHLKDKLKIRRKKRWSQVMYMYYLLGYRLMARPITADRKVTLASRTFLLTLDGDVDFRPAAVQRLVDLMVKHKDLGAACGRIHPVGTGMMVWFQKYEYAIGHWLQKATEHMIGCVLCSPGCFSLFRAESLMDENVMKKYTSSAEKAIHHVQYDQGEDRWLCTLLLKQGYRIEYSAASDALTQSPETFKEFYSQRRRWLPSTLANVLDILMDFKHVVRKNNNINILFILYEFVLMIGSFLGPGTIFIMLVGSLSSAFDISMKTSFIFNIIPVLLFLIVCFVAENGTQVLFAQLLSALYALLMLAVLIGVTLELTETGPGAPSAIFLMIMFGSAVVAALLHPQECTSIIYVIMYFLSIPSIYLLLTIYAFVNLNCDQWGTRDNTKSLPFEKEEESGHLVFQDSGNSQGNKLLQFLGIRNSRTEEEGNISCGFANLFKFICCTYPKPSDEKYMIMAMQEKLESVQKEVSNIGKAIESGSSDQITRPGRFNRRSSIGLIRHSVKFAGVEEENEEQPENEPENESDAENVEPYEDLDIERDELINPYWIDDLNKELAEKDALYKGVEETGFRLLEDDPRDIPDTPEEREKENEFWKSLIQAYLSPIDEGDEKKTQEKSKELKELRNRVVFALIMINAVFILVVFLLQAHKNMLHLKWPLGVKVNITFIPRVGEIQIEEKHMELDPVGLAFVVAFTLVLIIQFIAMVFHRFETFTTIIADISLSWFNERAKKNEGELFLNKKTIKLIQENKTLDEGADESESSETNEVSPLPPQRCRRGTVHILATKDRRKSVMRPLDDVYSQNLEAILNDAKSEISEGSVYSSSILKKTLKRKASMIKSRRNTLRRSTSLYERRSSFRSSFDGRNSVRSSMRSHIPMRTIGERINEGYESDENGNNSGGPNQQVTVL